MKKIITQTVLATAFMSFIACNSETKNTENNAETATESTEKQETVKSNVKTKTFEDDYIKFDLPEEWNPQTREDEKYNSYTLFLPEVVKNSKDIVYSFTYHHKNETTPQKTKEDWEKYYGSPEIIRSEIVKTKSGDDAFYIEYKGDGKTYVVIQMPVNNDNPTYELKGYYEIYKPEIFDQNIKNDALLNVVKSIEIKAKN